MSFVKVWIHAVWSTKNWKPSLRQESRQLVFDHMLKNAKMKGILVDSVGGYNDHVHILFRLKNDQALSKVIQLIKGESSHWINNQDTTRERFEWQKEYFAVSVSEDQVERVRSYIQNQSSRHRTKPFQEVYKEFVEKYGFAVKG